MFKRYLWLLPVGLLFVGTYHVGNYWAVRKRAFKLIAQTRLTQAIGAAFAMACLFPLGALGLIIGQIVGSAAGLTTLAKLAIRENLNVFRSVTVQRVIAVARRYRRFPQIGVITDLINVLSTSLPLLFFTSLFGILVAGQFVLVSRIVRWPMNLIGNSIAQVYHGEAAVIQKNQPLKLRLLFLRTSLGLAIIGAAISLVLALFGPLLFTLVFGGKWAIAGNYAQWLGIMVAFQLVCAPLSQTLNILERQSWRLAINILRTSLVLTTFSLAGYFAFNDIFTVALYSLVMATCYALIWLLNLYSIHIRISLSTDK